MVGWSFCNSIIGREANIHPYMFSNMGLISVFAIKRPSRAKMAENQGIRIKYSGSRTASHLAVTNLFIT
jgi:hypothetical protein